MDGKIIPCVNRDGVVVSQHSLIKYGSKVMARILSNATYLHCGNAPFV